MTKDNANNKGQYRNQFQVVIAGSNGYVSKSIAPQDGYTGPTYLGNAAINAPLYCAGDDTFMGSTMWSDKPFDAGLCAAACSAQSDYNLAHPPAAPAKPKTCQYFNTYLLLKNGVTEGQYCAMVSLVLSQVPPNVLQIDADFAQSTPNPGTAVMLRTPANTAALTSTPLLTATLSSTPPTPESLAFRALLPLQARRLALQATNPTVRRFSATPRHSPPLLPRLRQQYLHLPSWSRALR